MTRSFLVFALLVSSSAFASVDYAALNGKYAFVSGSGNSSLCEAGVTVEADAAKNEVVLKNDSGYVGGFFNINQGPQNECCTGSDLFYHHDDETTGEGTSVHEAISEYYQVIRKDMVSATAEDLVLTGDTLTYHVSSQDYEEPTRSAETRCTFKKL